MFLFHLPLFLPNCGFFDILSQHKCSCPSSSFCLSPDLLSALFIVTGVFLFPCCLSSHSHPQAEALSWGCEEFALQANLGRVLHLPPAFTLEARCGLWNTKPPSPWILLSAGFLLWGLLQISSLELLHQHFYRRIPQSLQNLLWEFSGSLSLDPFSSPYPFLSHPILWQKNQQPSAWKIL